MLGSVVAEATDGVQRQTGGLERIRTAEIGQVDNGGRLDDIRAQALQQLGGRHHRPAGCDEIVDQQHALTRAHRVGMHFHGSIAVLERVLFRHRAER